MITRAQASLPLNPKLVIRSPAPRYSPFDSTLGASVTLSCCYFRGAIVTRSCASRVLLTLVRFALFCDIAFFCDLSLLLLSVAERIDFTLRANSYSTDSHFSHIFFYFDASPLRASAACRHVTVITRTISSTEQPRDKSFIGLRSP